MATCNTLKHWVHYMTGHNYVDCKRKHFQQILWHDCHSFPRSVFGCFCPEMDRLRTGVVAQLLWCTCARVLSENHHHHYKDTVLASLWCYDGPIALFCWSIAPLANNCFLEQIQRVSFIQRNAKQLQLCLLCIWNLIVRFRKLSKTANHNTAHQETLTFFSLIF